MKAAGQALPAELQAEMDALLDDLFLSQQLADNTLQSIETSSLHIDLISDLRRINSLLCSIAYPILENAGVLAPSRLREKVARV